MSVDQFPMGPIREGSPEGEEDAYKDLFDMLADQMEDPYVTGMHAIARAHEQLVNESDGDLERLTDQLTDQLDKAWVYHSQEIELTAPVWLTSRATGLVALENCAQFVGQKVISHGFIFRKKILSHDREGLMLAPIRVAHYVEVPAQEQWPEGLHAVAFIDDIQSLTLPHPSLSMREKNFGYYHADLARTIDELVAEARRPDQMFRDIATLSIDIDEGDDAAVESLHDFEAFLRAKLVIDPIASYRMGIQGEFVRISDEGELRAVAKTDEWRRVMKIEDVCLLPRPDQILSHEPNVKTYYPTLYATTLEPEAGSPDLHLYIPCDTISWISSSRYDNNLPPTLIPDDNVPAEHES